MPVRRQVGSHVPESDLICRKDADPEAAGRPTPTGVPTPPPTNRLEEEVDARTGTLLKCPPRRDQAGSRKRSPLSLSLSSAA